MNRGHQWNEGARSRPWENASSAEEARVGELAQVAQRAAAAPAATNDDSGLIDLHALMAAAQARQTSGSARVSGNEPTPIPVVRNLEIYPLGAPPSLESVPPPLPVEEPAPRHFGAKNTAFLVLGAVALAGALAAILVARAPHEAQPAAHAAAPAESVRLGAEPEVVDATSPVRESAKPAPSDAPAETAKAVESAKPVVAAQVRPKPPVRRPAPAVQRPASPASTAQPAVKPPDIPPAKPVDPCNGDLMCAMKRATQGK